MQTEIDNVTNSWELSLDRLEKLIKDFGRHECEVIVLLAKESAALTYVRGSKRGINFLHRHPSLSADFLQFCSGKDSEEMDDLPDGVPLKVEMEDKDGDSDTTIDVQVPEMKALSGSATDIDEELDGEDDDMTDENLDDRISDKCGGETAENVNNDQENGIDELDETTDKVDITTKIASKKHNKFPNQSEISNAESLSRKLSDKMLIDYLRDNLDIKDLSSVTSEMLKSSDSDGVHRKEDASAMSKAVLFYDNLYATKSCRSKNTGECFLCNKKVLERQLENHMKEHKDTLEEIVLPCNGCGLHLPKPYLLMHDCVKMAERYMPKHITSIETDIWSFIAIIETQYQWKGFSKGIQCIKCGIKLKSMSHCREHLVKQHLKKYQCKLCSKVLHSYSLITKHTVEHGIGTELNNLNQSDDGKLICNQCGRQFTKRSSLRRHVERRHIPVDKKYYPCTMCKKKFRSQEVLDKHSLYHEEKWTCSVEHCNAEYSSALELRKHKRMVHKEHLKSRRFLCSICGTGFNRKATLTAHMEWKHDAGQPQTCEICNKVCRGKAALRCHLSTHQTKVERQCELCGKTFRTRNSLWKHKHKSHRDHPEIFRCEVCGKTLTTLRSFTHHIISQNHVTENQSVKKEAIHKCPYCGKLFGIKDKLTAHISCVHMQNKQHKCEVCGKAFADKSNYRQHMKIHFGSKPTCKSCKMTFRSELKLKQHLEEHAHMAQRSELKLEPHLGELAHTAQPQRTISDEKYEELVAWSSAVRGEPGTINYSSEPTEDRMNLGVEPTQLNIYPIQDGPSPQFILELKRVESSGGLGGKEDAF